MAIVAPAALFKKSLRSKLDLRYEREEMFIVQCSIVVCHRRWRFAQSFFKDAAPKAHPKMTNDN